MKAVSKQTDIAINRLLITTYGGFRFGIVLSYLKNLQVVTRYTIEVTRDQILFKIEEQFADESKNFKR